MKKKQDLVPVHFKSPRKRKERFMATCDKLGKSATQILNDYMVYIINRKTK